MPKKRIRVPPAAERSAKRKVRPADSKVTVNYFFTVAYAFIDIF